MLHIDHVIVGARDLDTAAARLAREHGLRSVPGGRHTGHGTANRIVPLGDSYLELMAVVDEGEAAGSPIGSWVRASLAARGEGPLALCLRADDLDGVARRLDRRPQPMSRTRPDGVELGWELVALDAAMADGLPFFIRWHVSPADLPGRSAVDHDVAVTGIEWVEVGGDPDRLSAWLGPHDLPLRVVDGAPGPHRLAIGLAGGDAIVLGP
jgi:Glyoxalase-like domain